MTDDTAAPNMVAWEHDGPVTMWSAAMPGHLYLTTSDTSPEAEAARRAEHPEDYDARGIPLRLRLATVDDGESQSQP